ncbi:YceI family protein [Wenzhouxiangella sp. XN79A]|uniref:YceI family protein n=1 Tax=Wenzhouxiangella sp. XN79A TaxID=2724193 RepID=UPI00144A6532|nr:YceI family protein [Wenzhouxiangella sp. XN79A]NKI36311.1 YceI family protein [Wenzhouxiangella sp. XN79A]
MELTTRLCIPALAWLLAAAPLAAETCYVGGADNGRLEFRGAVEGTGFTGTFGKFDVRYCMPEGAPVEGSIEVTVALGSADSDNRDRDEALLGPEFFAVERFPESTWTSTAIRSTDDGYTADGELTLRDITAAQSIAFQLTPDGEAIVAEGRFTMGGSAEIDRSRFDVGIGEFEDPEFVRNRVDVTFEVVLNAE